MPRVSVIIATYNRSELLPWSVGSVLRQTHEDFEVLVVGDGCDDDSADVVAALGDARVRWTNLPHNTRHQSGPNNEGLRQARGEFIAYLGHDDLWLPHHLTTLLAALDAGGADLAHSIALNVAPDGRRWATLPDASVGSWASPLAMVHRRALTERCGGWRDYREITLPPDVDLWRRLHGSGARFDFVPRLTAIKFPALLRRDAYRTKDASQLAAWSARLGEPALEADLLVGLLQEASPGASMVSWRQEVRHFLQATGARVRARWRLLQAGGKRPGVAIDVARRHKGLED